MTPTAEFPGIDAITLDSGSHDDRSNGLCIMEAAAWMAGESHGDHPACVSPVLGAFFRSWNDALDDEGRQRLKGYLPQLLGTAGDPAADERRAWMATDWLVRECAPAWLELANLKDQAASLRSLPAFTSSEVAAAHQEKLAAARDAAWDAAESALAPTRDQLLESAHRLAARMVA